MRDLADEPLLCLNIHTYSIDSIAVVGRRTVLLDFFQPFSLSASEALDHSTPLSSYSLPKRFSSDLFTELLNVLNVRLHHFSYSSVLVT